MRGRPTAPAPKEEAFGVQPHRRGASADHAHVAALLPGWRKDGKCYAVCRLPDYGIARITVGSATKRRIRYGGVLRRTSYDVRWEGSFSPQRAMRAVLGSPCAAGASR